MRTRAVAIFAVVFSIGLSCATASHQEYQSSVLDGWASRLSIPVDESHSNRQDEKVAGSSRVNVESVSPSLVLSKYAVSKAYHWLFEEAEEILKAVVEEQEIEKPVWKDTAPRFIVYGNEHVQKSSLGLPDPATLRGVTHYLIPFWTTKDGITESMLHWTHSTAAERKAIVQEYNTHGIRLGMTAYFANSGRPNTMAKRMAKFAKKYHFQGINIDYKDYDLFDNGNATAWLVPLARRLRIELPSEEGFFLSHAPVASLFNSNKFSESYSRVEEIIGEAIDFYSVQMDGSSAYTTCRNLIHESSQPYPQSALLELNRVWKIPTDKLVISKPAIAHERKLDQYHMKAETFAWCLGEAFSEGWKGGVSWEQPDGTSTDDILPPILDQMRHYPHRKIPADHHHHLKSPKHRRARHAARATEARLL